MAALLALPETMFMLRAPLEARGLVGGIEITSSVLRFEEVFIDRTRLHELIVGAGFKDTAFVHDPDLVAILNGKNTLSDYELRDVWMILLKTFTDEFVGMGIASACRVVEDEDLRVLKKRSCYAKSLFLATRNVRATLFDLGV